ncbi:MAG: hypothetical protein WCA89_09635 [Terracidiphilus sp.]
MRVTVAEMNGTLDRLDEDFYNHGGPTGLKTQFSNFLAVYKDREERRSQAESLWRWIIGIILSTLTLGVLALTWMQGIHNVKDITQQINHIFHSESQSEHIMAHSISLR